MLSQFFEPASQHSNDHFWTSTAIQQEMKKHLKSADVPNLTNLGLALKKLRWQRFKVNGVRGYYLKLRQEV